MHLISDQHMKHKRLETRMLWFMLKYIWLFFGVKVTFKAVATSEELNIFFCIVTHF